MFLFIAKVIIVLSKIFVSYTLSINRSFCLVSNLISRNIKNKSSVVYPYPEFYFPRVYNVSLKFPSEYPQQCCPGGNDRYMFIGKTERQFRFENALESWIEKVWYRHEEKVGEQNSSCVYDMCPLFSENVARTWSKQMWNFSADALCGLSKYLNKNIYSSNDAAKAMNTVNVIVFGGSMTIGMEAVGACCSPSSDGLCEKSYNHMNGPLSNDLWYCFWFGYLSRWFTHAFPQIKFIFHNLAVRAYSSELMSTEVNALLRFRNIKLSKQDVIILDHSCNDNYINAAKSAKGLELLIREIYRHCHNFDPTIIIMEQFPSPNANYHNEYQKVARYYELPYFSHREVILNPTLEQKNIFSMISSFTFHVPWHVHMLIADELANWITDLITYKCSPKLIVESNFALNPWYINSSIQVIKKLPTIRKSTSGQAYLRYDKIHSLFSVNNRFDNFQCKMNDQSILASISPINSSFIPSNLTEFEKTLTGWTEYSDYKLKPPGWIVNNYAYKENRTLTFPFPLFNTNIFQPKNNTLGLIIKYLKTYVNAGHAIILLCGERIAEIDSLTMQHISVPSLFYYVLSKKDIKRCKKVSEKLRTLLIHYTGDSHPHFRDNRKDFKLKIFSLKICYIDL